MHTEVFRGILTPFLGTMLGSACVLFMKSRLNLMLQRALTGFVAGVMVADSIWSLESILPEYTWVRDVSLVEGMKVIMPVYHLLGWIPAVKNISNKLTVLRKGVKQ